MGKKIHHVHNNIYERKLLVENNTRHLHNGILLSHKKENFALCNSIDEPGERYAD